MTLKQKNPHRVNAYPIFIAMPAMVKLRKCAGALFPTRPSFRFPFHVVAKIDSFLQKAENAKVAQINDAVQ